MVDMSLGGRRPELDGVRGIAILLVLVGHTNSQLQPLGAAGVALFFTLSGYLITSLLMAERECTGRAHLRRFYTRRFTRLAPPLFVTLLVFAPFSGDNWPHLLAPALWLTNYANILGLRVSPFPHTWSLAVEEQFYLIWPLMLPWLLRRRRGIALLLATVAVLIAWRLLLTFAGHFTYVYMALETAGIAILAGCLVALTRVRPTRSLAAVSVVFLVLASLAASGFETAAACAVTPVVVLPAAVGLVASAGDSSWLRWRPLAFCGVASYSMYLWHVPVSLAVGVAPIGVMVGALVGLVAYTAVERPLMRWRARPSAGAGHHPAVPVALAASTTHKSAATSTSD